MEKNPLREVPPTRNIAVIYLLGDGREGQILLHRYGEVLSSCL